MITLSTIFLVFLGGGIGTILRYQVGRLVGERYTGQFPMGTFLINISGAFLMGLLSTMLDIDWRSRYSTVFNSLVLTGMLGGYTTFSSYELDSATVYNKKERVVAGVYWLGSVLAGLAAAAIGRYSALAIG